MRVHLIFFELGEMDIILGINFFTKYHAVLNCFNKEVVFKGLGKFEVCRQEQSGPRKHISVFKARKLIKKKRDTLSLTMISIRMVKEICGSTRYAKAHRRTEVIMLALKCSPKNSINRRVLSKF